MATERLRLSIAGLDFPNPLGIAAGYDKNAEVPDPLLALGFGFVEVGTVTPLPQDGNPKPRIFRLPAEKGVINRLGFNNEGHEAALLRLMKRRHRGGIVGVNIGANKDSVDRAADYVAGIRTFASYASFFTANISSPNTPGLRDLQSAENLTELLSRIMAARDAAAEEAGRRVPVFLKIAPDLQEADLDHIARAAQEPSAGRADRLQHYPVARQRSRPAEGGRGGRPLRQAALSPLDDGAGEDAPAGRSAIADRRRRRRPRFRKRAGEDPRRRRSGAALFGHDL